MFGTDFPMGSADGETWTRDILRAIADTEMSDDHRRLLLSGNIQRLLGTHQQGS